MSNEKRVYKIYVGNIDEKDVRKYMDDVVLKFKNKTVMGPGIVYAPYIPLETEPIVIGDYELQGKILKVKEWLRFKKYFKKTVNSGFYTTVSTGEIPEIDIKIESKTVEGGIRKIGEKEWRPIAGEKIGQI